MGERQSRWKRRFDVSPRNVELEGSWGLTRTSDVDETMKTKIVASSSTARRLVMTRRMY